MFLGGMKWEYWSSLGQSMIHLAGDVPSLYHQEAPESMWFSSVLGRYGKVTLARKELSPENKYKQ